MRRPLHRVGSLMAGEKCRDHGWKVSFLVSSELPCLQPVFVRNNVVEMLVACTSLQLVVEFET